MRFIIAATFIVVAFVGIAEAEIQADWLFKVSLVVGSVACAVIAGVELTRPRSPSPPSVRVRLYSAFDGSNPRRLLIDATAEQLASHQRFTDKPLAIGDWELHFERESSP